MQAKRDLTCEDTVSRADVIKVVDKHTNDDGTLDDDISVILEEVSSVHLVRKKGKWIRKINPFGEEITVCSQCDTIMKQGTYNFCGCCGADMGGEEG